jgi:hypothetical protein
MMQLRNTAFRSKKYATLPLFALVHKWHSWGTLQYESTEDSGQDLLCSRKLLDTYPLNKQKTKVNFI